MSVICQIDVGPQNIQTKTVVQNTLLICPPFFSIDVVYTLLVGGLEHVFFSIQLGIILPFDFHIFQRGWNHQPDYVYVYIYIYITRTSSNGYLDDFDTRSVYMISMAISGT